MIDDKGQMISIAKKLSGKNYSQKKKILDDSREIKKEDDGIGQYGGFCITEKGRTVYLQFDTNEEKEDVLHVIHKLRDVKFREEYSLEIDEKLKTILTEAQECFESYIEKLDLDKNTKFAIIESYKSTVKNLAGYHGYEEYA